VQTVQSGPSAARLGGIRAASAYGALGRSSHNPPVVGSSPTRPTSSFIPAVGEPWTGLYTVVGGRYIGPSGRIRSHRATLDRLLARQGVGRNRSVHRPDPVSEADRRAAAYLVELTAGSATQSD
jgi:hypothetical protein